MMTYGSKRRWDKNFRNVCLTDQDEVHVHPQERLVSTETEALESVVPALPPAQQSASTTERDGWTRTSGIKTDVDPESDYFSSLGTEMRGQAARDAADKERARRQEEQRVCPWSTLPNMIQSLRLICIGFKQYRTPRRR